jgi:hypothetical protein
MDTVFLDALAEDLHRVRAAATQMSSTLSGEQLVWQPDQKSWGVAQCFDHLSRFDRLYARLVDSALDAAAPGAEGAVEYRPTWSGRLLIRGSSPRPLIPLRTPRFFRPDPIPRGEGAGTMRRFLAQQEVLLRLIERARGYDINRVRFPSPLSRLIRPSVGDALLMLVRHEQRHLHQAQRVLAHPGFPG